MADTEESPSQRQARIRREKREKKILEGGSSRLDRITNVSGHVVGKDDSPQTAPQQGPPSSASPQFKETAQLHTNPSIPHSQKNPSSAHANGPTQEQLEASMRQFLRQEPSAEQTSPSPPSTSSLTAANSTPRSQRQRQLQKIPSHQNIGPDGSANEQQEPQDPMLALLQQLMGGNLPPAYEGAGSTSVPGTDPGAQANPFESLPPALAAMLGANATGGPSANSQASEQPRNKHIWMILHALFSLLLAGYILYTYTFSGTLSARSRLASAVDSSLPIASAEGRIFWLFITAELGLQAARYLLEGGRSEEGMLKTVAAFLPPPWGGRVRLVGRYAAIWSTVVQDALVVVFLVGVKAWWTGDGDGGGVLSGFGDGEGSGVVL